LLLRPPAPVRPGPPGPVGDGRPARGLRGRDRRRHRLPPALRAVAGRLVERRAHDRPAAVPAGLGPDELSGRSQRPRPPRRRAQRRPAPRPGRGGAAPRPPRARSGTRPEPYRVQGAILVALNLAPEASVKVTFT